VATSEPALSGREALPRKDGGLPSPEDLNRSISRAAETIETIIDAAERLASEIRADAEAEAQRYLEESQREGDRLAMKRIGLMSELTESLIERAEDLTRRTDEVVRALEDAMRTIATTVSDRPSVDVERLLDNLQRPEGETSTGRGGATEAEPDDTSEKAASRAAHLAIQGSGRDEISATLGREYGIRDPSPILDRVLGSSG
jgi:hypothetical protein